MHATEFTRKPKAADGVGLAVLHGGERHLKSTSLALLCQRVLGTSSDEAIGLTKFAAKDLDFKTVRDELQMVSMFSDRKLVLVEDADDFISEFRSQLESYAEKPSHRSLLVLDVKTWRKNTRLAKKVDADGLEIECSELDGGRLTKWLTQQAEEVYQKQLDPQAAQLIPTLAGNSLGLLDQELAKLASYVGDRTRIGEEDVRTLVGGWKAETTWSMVDAIRDGKSGQALACLNKLLYAGEPAPKILGGLNYVFKKFAIASELSRKGGNLQQALKEAGVFPRDVSNVEKYLRRIRRPRAEAILETLAKADYGLKGGSRVPEQLQLEQLVLWLTGVNIEIV
ncbi:DNA polymerase III subunit delta [Planctomicrobium piriforme]|uniref:DNA polymerase III subunit delta n=1 Tax=Planctomicrobium piriforme TaxID=1576369 RepID=A0A1I3MQ72_9PLAN|nr:DNA polymerase III subunit delta [Planctomicrobium piriforme]SFI99071.1 DNA polymerase III, delta subunit [Planctomicrobium piriforme]